MDMPVSLALGLLLAGCATVPDEPHDEAAPRPNVLFLAVDDLNDWVGVLGGHPQGSTPHIDALARRGVLFTNAHASAPGCAPSRASVLTGVRPSTSGVYRNAHDWRACPELAEAVTLPLLFRRQGYHTLATGKLFHAHTFSRAMLSGQSQPEAWDAAFPSPSQQLAVGLAPEVRPVNSSLAMYDGYFDWAPMDVEDDAMGDGQVVAWAEERLREGSPDGRPVFLAVGIYRPHVPWFTPREDFDAFPLDEVRLPEVLEGDLDDVPDAGRRLTKQLWHDWLEGTDRWPEAVQAYLASMRFADRMVGRLVAALDEGPLAESTIVVLWSDHGYHLGEKQHWEKFALWEDTTRVPLIVIDPRRRDVAGGVCPEPVSLLDLYPTLVELCGLPSPPQVLEGTSLLPQLLDPAADSARAVVTTYGRGNHAVRGDRYRYIRYADGSEELYDHTSDPHEWHNLAVDPDLAEVKASLEAWLPAADALPMGGA